ncbi:hypothetical protein HY637_05015 [Candidatus Woesearchaeota archaeon]|nr:hypothetical protein [Candidatus Woesearchaeota archaeon]
MKQAIAGILIGLMFLMPIALAAEDSSKASVQGQASSVSVLDLRLKRVGEFFNDFAFKIKAALAFDNDAKLELLKERNIELKARQQSWVETKQEAMANIQSSNMTAKQKRGIIAVFQAEHEAIIEDRLELTEEIREVQLEARVENDAELEAEAEATAEAIEEDEYFLGVSIDIDLDSEVEGRSTTESRTVAKSRVESESEAKSVVRKRLGLEGANVKTVVEDSTTFYVVSGTETEVESDFTMTKEFEVWVDSETGMITSVDMDAHIESRGEAEAETENSASGSASASSSTKSSGKLKLGIFG